jgi:hypothetical protein
MSATAPRGLAFRLGTANASKLGTIASRAASTAAHVLPIIREIQAAGRTSLNRRAARCPRIAATFNGAPSMGLKLLLLLLLLAVIVILAARWQH